MFENLLLNIKSKINFNVKSQNEFIENVDLDNCNSSDDSWKRFSSGFFEKFNINRKRYTAIDQKQTNDDHGDAYYCGRHLNDTMMFPRVYSPDPAEHKAWEPISLVAEEKYTDDLDNVVDKFIRVIRIDQENNCVDSSETERFKVISFYMLYMYIILILENNE